MCEISTGENRLDKLQPAPLINDTLAGHPIFSVPIVIVAGNIFFYLYCILFSYIVVVSYSLLIHNHPVWRQCRSHQ